MAQQLNIDSTNIDSTKKYSFAWCKGGGGAVLTKEAIRTLPPYLPYGDITSATVYTTPLEASGSAA